MVVCTLVYFIHGALSSSGGVASERKKLTMKMRDKTCSVKNCNGISAKNIPQKFYSIPRVKTVWITQNFISVTTQRRAAWLRALNLNESDSERRFVCSLHFQSGIELLLINLFVHFITILHSFNFRQTCKSHGY